MSVAPAEHSVSNWKDPQGPHPQLRLFVGFMLDFLALIRLSALGLDVAGKTI